MVCAVTTVVIGRGCVEMCKDSARSASCLSPVLGASGAKIRISSGSLAVSSLALDGAGVCVWGVPSSVGRRVMRCSSSAVSFVRKMSQFSSAGVG